MGQLDCAEKCYREQARGYKGDYGNQIVGAQAKTDKLTSEVSCRCIVDYPHNGPVEQTVYRLDRLNEEEIKKLDLKGHFAEWGEKKKLDKFNFEACWFNR